MILVTLLLIVTSLTSSAQTLTAEYLKTAKHARGSFEKYITADSTVYAIGDAITLSTSSVNDDTYRHVTMITKDGGRMDMPVANNVDIVIKHIRVSYTDSFGYECLIEAVLPSSFRCLVSFDQALLSGEVKKGIVTSQDVEIDAYNPLSYQPAASIMVKADKNERSMLLASGLALEKAKKAKVASLCLATTAGVLYSIGSTRPQGEREFMSGLAFATGLASVVASFSSIHQIGRSGAYLQAYANGYIIIRF